MNNDHALNQALYQVAGCFHQPEPGLLKRLCELPDLLHPVSSEASATAGLLLTELEAQSFEELLREYSRLFLGPFQLEAPPFGSVYLESEGRLMGDSTAEVKEIYQKCGLAISPEFKNPPDHVAAELEFLAYLGFQEESSQEAQQKTFFRDNRALFLKRHVGGWFPFLADKIENNTTQRFYLALSRLTSQLLELQRSELGDKLNRLPSQKNGA